MTDVDPRTRADATEEKGSLVQRLLDGIERVGNKVPHPAIIFLGLCVLVIVLSAVLAAFDVSVTYDVAEQPPDRRRGGVRRRLGRARGSSRPASSTTTTSRSTRRPPRSRACSSTDGIRFLFSSFVNNFASFSVVSVVFVAMIGVGVAEEAGLMAALIRKLVKVAPAADAHLHHRVRRRPVERGHRRRLPDPDPARRGRLPQRRAPSARRPGRGLRRRQRRLRGQRPHRAARRPAHRGHQRGDRPGRPRTSRSTSPPTSGSRSRRRSSSPSSSRSSPSGSPTKSLGTTSPRATSTRSPRRRCPRARARACATPRSACSAPSPWSSCSRSSRTHRCGTRRPGRSSTTRR